MNGVSYADEVESNSHVPRHPLANAGANRGTQMAKPVAKKSEAEEQSLSLAEVAVKPVVSIEEAALLSGLGRTSIYGAVKSGALKARKAGRRTIVLKSDLQAWLAALPTIEPAQAA